MFGGVELGREPLDGSLELVTGLYIDSKLFVAPKFFLSLEEIHVSMSVLRLIPCRWVQSIDCAIHRSDQGVDTQLHCHDVSDRRLRAGP